MNDYEKLLAIFNEIDILKGNKVTDTSPEFITWKTRLDKFLRKKYGEKSIEYDSFSHTCFSLGFWGATEDEKEEILWCAKGLEETKAILTAYLEEIKESEEQLTNRSHITTPQKIDFSKVFIVHGHDEALKMSVANLIKQQNIEPVILNEKTNEGKTIIEKMEHNANVSAAVCLFTPDDTLQGIKKRARQNVVFETGYFMGKLGRERIIIIAGIEVEMPSDLGGVVYVEKNNWMVDLLKELHVMGYNIDLNLLIKK